jgi:phosphatidyl-myo-inositol alpha-mannosyltransferase
MKIGLVLPYSIIKGGGVKEIVLALQAELNRRGHDTYVITPRPQNHEQAPDDHVIFVGGSTDFRSPTQTTVQISAGVTESIKTMLEKENFDILNFHEPWVPMLSAQILTRSQAVNVATFHAKLPETVMSRTMAKVITPYTKPLLKYMDALTAPSEVAADYVCSLTDKPVAIIPNGIYLEDFKPPAHFNDNRKHKTILYVGRLEGRKGVKYLLHAFQELTQRRPNVSLIVAGDGPDRSKLEMLATDLEIEDKVTFLGFVSHDDKTKYYRSSDLFCAPALFGECFGVVLLEAMASGLVTVAGDNPGYATVMQGLGTLSLVDPKHKDEFARRLELLLYETDLRKLWRTWATEEVLQYSWDRVVEQYEEVFLSALKKKKRR